MSDNGRTDFVTELLVKPKTERLKAFSEYTTKHPLLKAAYEELKCAIRDSSPGSIIYIYGPPGVGKTTLLIRLEEHLRKFMLAKLREDSERIPVIRVRATAPTSGNFDWKEFLKRLLIVLEEPLIDRKIDMERWKRPGFSNTSNSESNRKLISDDRSGIRPMRFAYEQTLKHRRPMAVLVDDAQHFGILSSGRKLLDQLNIIKSISDESLVTHALCGTYEIIPFRNLNGQLSRRSINIHFGRYHVDDEAQRQQFKNVLYTFQEHLPLQETPDLRARWDYFYERSIGCIGVLKDWLTQSLSLALESNSHTLPLKFIERRALSVSQCSSMLREAIAGEKESEEREDSRQLLRTSLGLRDDYIVLNKEASPINVSAPTIPTSPRQRRQRVGSRKPVRDSVGMKAV
jgi:DNA polymerase III delta prime subunit